MKEQYKRIKTHHKNMTENRKINIDIDKTNQT